MKYIYFMACIIVSACKNMNDRWTKVQLYLHTYIYIYKYCTLPHVFDLVYETFTAILISKTISTDSNDMLRV